MKQKHIDIRITQCLALAKASGCPRRKLAALLIDPERNVVLSDGYNGGPRGAEGPLCRGYWCERDGFRRDDVEIVEGSKHSYRTSGGSTSVPVIRVRTKEGGHVLQEFERGVLEDLNEEKTFGPFNFPERPRLEEDPLSGLSGHVPATAIPSTRSKAEAWVDDMVEKYPPIVSGTRMERGCHHSEVNVICNAAANGIETKGAWLICLAEPCMMCAKMIHHAGIAKVILVDGGYMGGKDGVDYLKANGVKVEWAAGPRDPRFNDDT